ncbi:MAG: hypothetical protein AAFX50_05590, partial [Acidobacteriota bacterium]
VLLAVASTLDGSAEPSSWDRELFGASNQGGYLAQYLWRRGHEESAREMLQVFSEWIRSTGWSQSGTWYLALVEAEISGSPDGLEAIEREARRLGGHYLALEAAAVRARLSGDPEEVSRVAGEAEARGLVRIAKDVRRPRRRRPRRTALARAQDGAKRPRIRGT